MKQPRKINDKILLELDKQGLSQVEIARHFGVSNVAVHKRLKRLIPPVRDPLIMDSFTAKQQSFCIEIASGKSQTAAAMAAFDVSSVSSAKNIGSALMKKTDIQEAVSEIMNKQGIGREYRVEKLKSHIENLDPSISLRALDMGFKLADDYPANKNKNININADLDPVDMSKYMNRGED